MTCRNEIKKLVTKMNGINLYTWTVEDMEGRIIGVGSQAFRSGMVLDPLTAAEKMRGY